MFATYLGDAHNFSGCELCINISIDYGISVMVAIFWYIKLRCRVAACSFIMHPHPDLYMYVKGITIYITQLALIYTPA